MNAPIPVSEALRLLSMALEDCDKADAKQAGCAGRPDGTMKRTDLSWAIELCKENPTWRLSIQQHKAWSVR